VDNSRDETRERNKEKINDIRNKIRKSLNGDNKDILPGIKNNEKDKELPKEENYPGESYSGDKNVFNHSKFNIRSEKKELLAKEIGEILEDDHSLGAFRSIVDKYQSSR